VGEWELYGGLRKGEHGKVEGGCMWDGGGEGGDGRDGEVRKGLFGKGGKKR